MSIYDIRLAILESHEPITAFNPNQTCADDWLIVTFHPGHHKVDVIRLTEDPMGPTELRVHTPYQGNDAQSDGKHEAWKKTWDGRLKDGSSLPKRFETKTEALEFCTSWEYRRTLSPDNGPF